MKTINNEFLRKAETTALLDMGFGQWDEPNEEFQCLYLIPGKLYDDIEDGTVLISISNKQIVFVHGVSDNYTRMGCLPYGVMKFFDI